MHEVIDGTYLAISNFDADFEEIGSEVFLITCLRTMIRITKLI